MNQANGASYMIRIDIKQFIYDRIWFGYARGAVFVPFGPDISGGEWVWQWVKVTTWN